MGNSISFMRRDICFAPLLRRLIRAFGVALMVAVFSACSSGSGNSADDGPLVDIPDGPADDGSNPDDPTDPSVELTPVEKLMLEIKRTAADPILWLNQKIASGETLTVDEQACLGTFDPGVGESLTSIDCSVPLVVNSHLLTVTTTEFENSENCQSSLAENHVETCRLLRAKLAFRIEWVFGSDDIPADAFRVTPGLRPVAGTDINYNMDDDGILVLRDTTPITGSFNCQIEIATATQFFTDPIVGNCQSEIARTTDRLNELRTLQR